MCNQRTYAKDKPAPNSPRRGRLRRPGVPSVRFLPRGKGKALNQYQGIVVFEFVLSYYHSPIGQCIDRSRVLNIMRHPHSGCEQVWNIDPGRRTYEHCRHISKRFSCSVLLTPRKESSAALGRSLARFLTRLDRLGPRGFSGCFGGILTLPVLLKLMTPLVRLCMSVNRYSKL